MKLIQAFPNWINNGGIFSAIAQQFELPWSDRTITSGEIDIDYYGMFGDREVSPLIEKLLVSGVLSEQGVGTLAKIIWNRFGKTWTKLYATLNLDYNPIENYNLVERTTVERTNTRNSETGSNVETGSDNSVYGFNSTTDVPSERSRIKNESNTTGEERGNENEEIAHTKSGNVGVTTSQQMIEAERTLQLWDFFRTIYQQVNEVLTIPYYKY